MSKKARCMPGIHTVGVPRHRWRRIRLRSCRDSTWDRISDVYLMRQRSWK
jgi:hypothetical protein